MKLTELELAIHLKKELDVNYRIKAWLNGLPIEQGLQLYSNGVIPMIVLDYHVSIALLEENEREIIAKLRNLGIEDID